MTIKPIELQTIIPKVTELQRAKTAESELEKSSLSVGMHQDQQKHDQEVILVIHTKKSEGSKIDRNEQKKEKQGKQKKRQNEEKNSGNGENGKHEQHETSHRIDIKI
jgi:hypothetical protein